MKPMRARKDGKITFPCVAQIKIDGIRALVRDGVVYSRTLTPIPNKHVQYLFGHLHGYDGELLLSSDSEVRLFNETQSAVMKIEGEPEVYFHIYDSWKRKVGYESWYSLVENEIPSASVVHLPYQDMVNYLRLHPYFIIHSKESLDTSFNTVVESGYEGIIIRNPKAPYKYGTATKKDWQLVKMKPRDDAEFVVLGFDQEMISTVESTTDNLGRKKKLKKKGQETPSGMLANFICDYNGYRFKVPIRKGHTNEQRKKMWEDRESYVGKMIKVEYEGIAKNVPRFPRLVGVRDTRDIL